MNTHRCANCGFLNFTAASACKRCRTVFDETPSTQINQSDHYQASWQGGYEMAAQWPQPAYQTPYYPSPVAALPSRSKNVGANTLLWMLLGGVIVVAAAVGFLWKFNKPSSANYSWQEVQSPDNSFSISMPTKPVETIQNLRSDLQMHVLTGDMKRDGFYGVAYADYPFDASKVSANSILDNAAQGAASNSGAQISSKKSITLSGYPGLETDMEVPASKITVAARVACRMFWVSPRIYIVCAGGPEAASVYTSRTKFLDSFKLKK